MNNTTSNERERFLKLSLRQLEKLTGVSYVNWSDWFNSRNSPKFATMKNMAKKLNMPVMEFIEAFEERRRETMISKGLDPDADLEQLQSA